MTDTMTYFHDFKQFLELENEPAVVRAILDEYGRAWLVEVVPTGAAAETERGSLEEFAWDTTAFYAVPQSAVGRFMMALMVINYSPANHRIVCRARREKSTVEARKAIETIMSGHCESIVLVDRRTKKTLVNYVPEPGRYYL